MATTSEVKAGLDEIAASIRTNRRRFAQSKAAIVTTRDTLLAIPGEYQGLIDTVNGYVGTDPFEAVSKDELAKLTTEFVTLRDDISALITAAGL